MRSPRALVCVGAVLSLLLCAALASCAAGPNIYPDPGFEASGKAGIARTGDKAGYLRVDAMNHWAAVGGQIKVEPFARYRVTEWVKANIDKGSFCAPYCYEWDNYVWAFASTHAIKTLKDWTKTQVTFVSPHETMYVHPLAYTDAANCEAWVDDIVVEKIAEPEEVIGALKAKQDLDADEARILARWYVKQGDMVAAEALMRKTGGIVRSDIACLIAQNTSGLQARRPFVVEMVAYGGPTYNYGERRFGEITTGMNDAEKLAVREDAVLVNPGSGLAAKAFRVAFEGATRGPDAVMGVAEAESELQRLTASVKKLLASVPQESPARKELQLAMTSADEAADKLRARKAGLGKCVVKIGGKPIRRATHAILIPDNPTPQQHHAAKDLRYHLELMTGETLPIWYEKDADKCVPIVVGPCDVLESLGVDIDVEGLGIEGIHIKTAGPSVILAGNTRGVLYATYTFLEDYLGCRWFAPDCSRWPTDGVIEVPPIDKRYIPPLEYRATDYPSSRPADFAVRNKYNGNAHHVDEARGGKISYRGFVHTFNSLVPPGEYFAEHPEYYSEINGQRIGPEHTQLCLTNPDVLRIATDTVRRWMKESPTARIISVSQNDWHNYCQCDKCKALAEKEGSQSGPLLHFVNAIADAVREEHPDIIIDTLAYQYTRKPPLHVKPRPNVAVRLCSIECCFIHPLESDPYNATFADDIRGWNKICDRLHIWDYVINYAHSICPFPNLYVLKPNINFFINNGVTGIYEEACYYTKGSELQELRTYVMAKLLWDPTYDTDKAIDEFCEAYYGPAARYVREFLDVVHASAQSIPDMHVRIYSPPNVGYLTPEVMSKSRDLFDQAQAAVKDDPKLLHRVKVARLPVIYAQIAMATGGKFKQQDGKLVVEAGTDIGSLAKQFEETARAEGITRVREGGPLRTLDAWLESLPGHAKELKIETIGNGKLELAILPDLGGRIWRMRLAPDGRDLLYMHGKADAWDPGTGGYEEYSEVDYRSAGWSEAYRITEQTPSSITLQTDLKSGLRVTRQFELASDQATVRVRSTVTNSGNTARDGMVRVHPEFLVASTRNAQVRLLQKGGRVKSINLANPEDPKAEKEQWLTPKDIEGGAWAVFDKTSKTQILNRVNTDQIDRLLLNYHGGQSRVNLELFGKQKKLGPGESVTVEHSYEVTVGGK